MFACVVGTSTGFTYWAFGAAWAALEEYSGAVHHVHCTSIAQMHAQWEKRDGRSVLFTTDFLEGDVSNLILSSGAPLVVIADTAELAIVTAAKFRPMSFLDSIRHTSMYICSLADILAESRTVLFASRWRETRLCDFLPEFMRSLGLPHDPALCDRVSARLCADENLRDSLTIDAAIKATQPLVAISEYETEWSERQLDAFHKVAADYQAILDRRDARRILWPAAIFHSQVPDYSTDNPLPLIGPARPLIWGPYMHLPKGRWVASMEFEVSDGHSPNTVVAAVLLGGDFVVQGDLHLPVQGVFVWNLEFDVVDVSLPIEVRMTLARSAIEGTFLLRTVRLSRAEKDEAAVIAGETKPTMLPPG